jgi:hypothetical protein
MKLNDGDLLGARAEKPPVDNWAQGLLFILVGLLLLPLVLPIVVVCAVLDAIAKARLKL